MGETIYFLGVKNGVGSRGELVFPDQNKAFYAGSGTSTLRRLPEGEKTIGDREAAEKKVSLGKAKYKYRITGVTKDGEPHKPGYAYDPDAERDRSGLLIHPDSNGPGTAGCIGVRGTPTASGRADATDGSADMVAVQEVDDLLNSGRYDKVVVKHFDTVEEMEAYHKKIAPNTEMKNPDPEAEKKKKEEEEKKKKEEEKKNPSKGEPSKTDKSAELLHGEPSVLAGKNRLQVAFAGPDCVHTGGGCVVEGSNSVFVGPKRRPMARVTDLTSDGHQVSTGELTVETG